jgi:hypothetical protein
MFGDEYRQAYDGLQPSVASGPITSMCASCIWPPTPLNPRWRLLPRCEAVREPVDTFKSEGEIGWGLRQLAYNTDYSECSFVTVRTMPVIRE